MINNFFFLATILFFPFHDFHVTPTTFHYNDQSKSMEITIKVAIEDLEKSIKNRYSKKLDCFEDNQEKIIGEYFLKVKRSLEVLIIFAENLDLVIIIVLPLKSRPEF